MKYIIISSIMAISSIILFFALNKFKKTRIILISLIWASVCTFTVADYFFEKPLIIIVGDDKETVRVQTTYVEKGAKAEYHFQDVSQDIVKEGEVDTSVIGKYEIKYSITKDKKTAEKTRTVEVIDDVEPVITLKGEENVIASSLELYTEPGYEAIDNYDKELTDRVTTELVPEKENIYNKVYTVTDSSGNKASVIRKVEIKDIVPPIVSLNGTGVENVYQGGEYNDSWATASDDLDGDVSETITTSGNVDTSKVRNI